MSGSTFFVSEAAVRNLKDTAKRRISGVQSSHLSEGIAAALGFKTNAAPAGCVQGPVDGRSAQTEQCEAHGAPAEVWLRSPGRVAARS